MNQDKIAQCEADIVALQKELDRLKKEDEKVFLGDVYLLHDDVIVMFIKVDENHGELIYVKGINPGDARSRTRVTLRDGYYCLKSDFIDKDLSLLDSKFLGKINTLI